MLPHPYKRSFRGGGGDRARQRAVPVLRWEDQKSYTPSPATYHHRRRPIVRRMPTGLWNRLGRRKGGEETDASTDAEEEARVAGLVLSLESKDIAAR